MTDFGDAAVGWEEAYASMLARLTKARPEDGALSTLAFAEEARASSGSDDYVPEWFGPYLSVAFRLFAGRSVADAEGSDGACEESSTQFRPAILRAIQLGYTEGYFAGKDDA